MFGVYSVLKSPQNFRVMPWFVTRAGPGSPATELIPAFAVAAMQKTAAPIGASGSATPVAVIVSRKQGRGVTIVQSPASMPMLPTAQSAFD